MAEIFKRTPLAFGRPHASSALVHRGFAPLEWDAAARLMADQDDLVAGSCRQVAALTMGGEHVFSSGDGIRHPVDDEAYLVPEAGWYVGVYAFGYLTPGCFLRASVVYHPAGSIAEDIVDTGGGFLANPTAPWGGGQAGIAYVFGLGADVQSGSIAIPMETSRFPPLGGGSPGDLQWNGISSDTWAAIQLAEIDIRPPNIEVDVDMLQGLSEWATYQVVLQWFGAARIIDFVLYEVPFGHAQLHNESTKQSVHCFYQSNKRPRLPTTRGPQTDAADPPDNDERRFGTTQIANVVNKQAEFLGPRIMQWSPYSHTAASAFTSNPGGGPSELPHTSGWTNHNHHIVTLMANAGWTDIVDDSITDWDADNPGWICAGVGALRSRYNGATFQQDAGYVPVRVWVYGSASSDFAEVKVQSSPYDAVIVRVDTTEDWYAADGWLQCQVSGDQAATGSIQVLYRTDSDATLDIAAVCVDFGHMR